MIHKQNNAKLPTARLDEAVLLSCWLGAGSKLNHSSVLALSLLTNNG